MICSFKTMTIMLAGNGRAFLLSTDRDGMEQEILKEKASKEDFRRYYCTCCKQFFDGESPADWEKVKQHFGKEIKQEFDIPDESEIIDLASVDLEDPSLRPTVRKLVKQLLEVFGDATV